VPASFQGNLTGRYTLVPRTLIFLTCGNRILLLKGAPEKRLWANLYNGIGGHVERGEDVLGAALRELHEEAGFSRSRLNLRGVITIDTGQEVGIGLYVFLGKCSEAEAENIRNNISSIEGTLEWVKKADIDRLPLVEDLPILLPRLLSMKPSDHPFSACYRYNDQGKLQIEYSG
jgi:8-oxo-dGTP diphosphatase